MLPFHVPHLSRVIPTALVAAVFLVVGLWQEFLAVVWTDTQPLHQ
jgi:hypothetical protein